MTVAKNQQDADNSTDLEKTAVRKPTATKPDEMSDELIKFITAIDEYKRVYQRPFPSWGEVLEILKQLGYERQP